jgi:ABC-type branched-subunit amino acid transport system permease subunit
MRFRIPFPLAVGYLARNIVVRTGAWAFVGIGAFAATVMMAPAGQNSSPVTVLSAAILIPGGIALVVEGGLTGRKPSG